MPLLKFLSLLVIAIWVGGLAALGFVAAPGIFAVIEAHDPVAGATLAGTVFGTIFQTFTRVSLGLGVALAFLFVARAALGGPLRHIAGRLIALGVMVAATAVGGLIIAPRIDAIRIATSGPIANLPDGDPEKTAFGRLHAASGGLMLVTLALGAGLLWMELPDRRLSNLTRP